MRFSGNCFWIVTMERIDLYDTTLRDGMQAEGISFSLQDKLLIARRLDEFGIDYIEGGYAGSNPKDIEFFADLAGLGLANAKVVAFGNTRRVRTKVGDDPSLAAVLACKVSAAALVGKTWDMHVTDVLGCDLDENLKICAESVKYIKGQGMEALFDAEHFYDGYKANPKYAMKVLEASLDAGADVIILCETNGGALPTDVYEITKEVAKAFPNAKIGVHAHNDSDCAVANSLAAVSAGTRHVQGTINGLGERCGNANLCTIIPNLVLKSGFAAAKPDSMKSLTELSRFFFEMANMAPVTNMPFVGESAFAHKAGLHVNAIRKNKKSYEHIDPSLVGNERRFLISELSGSSNILAKLEKQKLTQDKTLARNILRTIKKLENEGYQFEAAEGSFDILVKKALGTYKPSFELIKYHVDVERNTAGDIVTEASVKLRVDGVTEHVVSEGDGPVNALDEALRKSLCGFYPNIRNMRLTDYKVRVVNAKAATAAKVRVIIESRDADSVWGTVGVSENIIEASWKALLDSVEYKLLKDADTAEKT
jgi:2-isopropylmalate synthase